MRQVFPPLNELIQYQGVHICAVCKPLFIQKLREGGPVAGDMEYGGFWIRFAAKIIDDIVVGILQLIILLPMGFFSMEMEWG